MYSSLSVQRCEATYLLHTLASALGESAISFLSVLSSWREREDRGGLSNVAPGPSLPRSFARVPLARDSTLPAEVVGNRLVHRNLAASGHC